MYILRSFLEPLGKLISAKTKTRGQERIWRAGLTGITGFLSQGTIIAIGFISVPLTVNYLGKERYGVWLTINSLLNWLEVSKMGFGGNALINSLAEANGRDDKKMAQELVATAFWSLSGLAALLAVGIALVFPFISWSTIFNSANAIPESELQWAAIWAVVIFLANFPISLVGAVYQSYQRGYVGNIWGIAGSVVSLLALLAVTKANGGLPLLVLALSGVHLIVRLGNAMYMFGGEYPWLKPTPREITRNSFRRLSSLGGKYLIAQLAGIGMFQSQPLIITQILGPTQVGIFNIAQRIMTLPLTVVQMFTTPLMPAYGEAQARADWPWIRQTLRRTLIGAAIISVILIAPLIYFANPIISMWVGSSLMPEPELIISLGIYAVIASIVTPASVMLYGVEKVGGQALIATLNAVITVIMGIVLTKGWGISGMAMAMIVALFSVNFIGQSFQLSMLMNAHKKQVLA